MSGYSPLPPGYPTAQPPPAPPGFIPAPRQPWAPVPANPPYQQQFPYPAYPPGSVLPAGPARSRGKHGPLIAVITLLMVASVIAVAVFAGSRLYSAPGPRAAAGAGSGSRPVVPAAPSPSLGQAQAQRLPVVSAFVAEFVGVPFAQQPKVVVLGDEQFDAAYRNSERTAAQPAGSGDPQATVKGLGLRRWGRSVAGFYDPKLRQVTIAGTQWTPWVESVAVHELTHALQDQMTGLDGHVKATSVQDDSYLALATLYEGHAMVVERSWVRNQDRSYQLSYAAADDAGADLDHSAHGGDRVRAQPDTGRYDDAVTSALYVLGETSVADLQSRAGSAVVRQVLGSPPRTMEQVTHLYQWQRADPRYAPGTPVPVKSGTKGELLDSGSLGVLPLTMLTVPDDDADWTLAPASGLISGWAGDTYETRRSGSKTCTVVAVRFDDQGSAASYLAAAQPFRSRGGTADLLAPDTVRLQRCG